jgi:pimeloyl-ACP methyl ester carboxylesterase
MGPNASRRAAEAYRNLVGPFLVEGAGHFLSWERPRLLNDAIISFCRDLLSERSRQS